MSSSVGASLSKRTILSVLDEPKLGWSRIISIAILFVVIGLDGADVISGSLLYSSIISGWGVSDQVITAIVTFSLVAMAIGALIAGPLADRLGRKRLLTISIATVMVCTYATAASQNVEFFFAMRSITMLALGAAMPIAVALASEIVPSKRRSFLVAVVFAGYTAGTAVAGLLAAQLIPTIGWKGFMVVIAALATLVLPLVIGFVPESLQHLASRPGNEAKLKRILSRIDPNLDVSHVSLAPQIASDLASAKKGAIRTVLSRRFIVISIGLWFCYFAGIAVVYLFQTYFPLIVVRSGLTISEAGIIVSVSGIIGIAGSVTIGFLMDRIGRFVTLIAAWLIVIVSFWLVGTVTPGFVGLLLFNVVWGFLIAPTNTGLNALAATSYPAGARATGVGWMHSFGRVGAIVTGIVGGVFLTLGWSIGTIFAAMSVPLVLGVIALAFLGVAVRREERTAALQGDPDLAPADQSVTA